MRSKRGPIAEPDVIERGGKRSVAGAVTGFTLGAACLPLFALLSDQALFIFFGVLLGMIAAVYLGFALADGRVTSIWAESLAVVIFGTLATSALTLEQPLVLVAGFVGHGMWDAIHPHAVDTGMPAWYAPLCIGFDFVFAAYILLRFS